MNLMRYAHVGACSVRVSLATVQGVPNYNYPVAVFFDVEIEGKTVASDLFFGPESAQYTMQKAATGLMEHHRRDAVSAYKKMWPLTEEAEKNILQGITPW